MVLPGALLHGALLRLSQQHCMAVLLPALCCNPAALALLLFIIHMFPHATSSLNLSAVCMHTFLQLLHGPAPPGYSFKYKVHGHGLFRHQSIRHVDKQPSQSKSLLANQCSHTSKIATNQQKASLLQKLVCWLEKQITNCGMRKQPL